MVQISGSLSLIFSAVEHLTLEHKELSQSLEDHNKVDRTKWLKLLRPFRNVKTLWIEGGLIEGLFRWSGIGRWRAPLELLPELQELTHFGSCDVLFILIMCLSVRYYTLL